MRIVQSLISALGLTLGSSYGVADTLFTATYAGSSYQIESARGNEPLIKHKDKWVVPKLSTMNLEQNVLVNYTKDGFPKWAYVTKVKAELRSINLVDVGATINSELNLEFAISASSELKNVFVAIYVDGGPELSGIIVRDVGDLKQWGTRHVTASFRVDSSYKNFNYKVFVFSGGRELYTNFTHLFSFLPNFLTALSDSRKDGKGEKMKLLYSFLPLEARRSKVAVKAHLRIRLNGGVEKVEVVSSDKKLSKSIEEAVKYWWFAPPAQCRDETNLDILIHLDQWKSWGEHSVEILPSK